jgi:hypothetical protein
MSVVLLAMVVCLTAQAPPPVAGGSPPDLAGRVAELVRKLDSPEASQREEAQRQLLELGPQVLPLLPSVTRQTPAEVRARLDHIYRTLTRAEIEAAVRPSPVTLAGPLPLSQAMAAIASQSGNRLIDYRRRFQQEADDPVLDLTLNQRPFWEALDQVLDAAGLTLYPFPEERGVLAYVVRPPSAARRAKLGCISGCFRFEPSRLIAQRDLRQPSLSSLRLTMDVLWEPRLRPIALEVPLAELKAEDDKGQALTVDSRATVEVPVDGVSSAASVELPLPALSRSSLWLARVSGTMTALVLGRAETFEFPQVARARQLERQRGGVTVVLEQARKSGELFEVTLRVRFERAANALESHRGWIYDNEAYLLDRQGRRRESVGLEATLLMPSEVGLSYKFEAAEGLGDELTFVYRTPADIHRLSIPWELKDLELP